tara:strand:- start:2971 stop:3858 length:888 start_codon:yes stop_codon:yes gene_type:complete
MVSRTGILSDKSFADNCLEYRALPVGYATAHLRGHQPNPEYMGIKTSKYQKASSKPTSADVLAVNMSKNFKGNLAANARQILDLYQKEAMEFKPPPVEIVGAYHYRMNDYEIEQYKPEYTQPVSIHPRVSRPSRGEQILKQSVSTSTGTDTMIEEYELAFRKRDVAGQKKASREIYEKLVDRGIMPEEYFPEASHLINTPSKWNLFINKEDDRIRDTMRLIDVGLARNANIDYMRAINPFELALSGIASGSQSTPPVKRASSSETARSLASTILYPSAVGQNQASNAKPAEIPEV